MELFSHPHKRYNILTGDWVLVSPHRTKRPWKGKTETITIGKKPQYDPGCYLCPGNSRAGGETNPDYSSTFVFTNDFAALYPETPVDSINRDNLLIAESETGLCKVVCYSPRHDLYLTNMDRSAIRSVVNVWQEEFRELGALKNINYVQIFENKGSLMGCSNPHPHGQIWANESIPMIPQAETEKQQAYRSETGTCLLCDYLAVEESTGERVVFADNEFTVLVPFWAIWPYEVIIIPRAHCTSILDMNGTQADSLADILKRLCIRYDNLFETEFPYSMGIHQKPTDGLPHDEWHFHLHYYPPLLRSATISKFMVGYELLAAPQRDITAESAAETLKNQSEIHYSEKR